MGTQVNLSHSAATPIGRQVTTEVKLSEIEGKKLTFSVKCFDEKEVICEGTLERFIIDFDKFSERVKAKLHTPS